MFLNTFYTHGFNQLILYYDKMSIYQLKIEKFFFNRLKHLRSPKRFYTTGPKNPRYVTGTCVRVCFMKHFLVDTKHEAKPIRIIYRLCY